MENSSSSSPAMQFLSGIFALLGSRRSLSACFKRALFVSFFGLRKLPPARYPPTFPGDFSPSTNGLFVETFIVCYPLPPCLLKFLDILGPFPVRFPHPRPFFPPYAWELFGAGREKPLSPSFAAFGTIHFCGGGVSSRLSPVTGRRTSLILGAPAV